jgi:hypothetical protein
MKINDFLTPNGSVEVVKEENSSNTFCKQPCQFQLPFADTNAAPVLIWLRIVLLF